MHYANGFLLSKRTEKAFLGKKDHQGFVKKEELCEVLRVEELEVAC